jgi:hypothetical protein
VGLDELMPVSDDGLERKQMDDEDLEKVLRSVLQEVRDTRYLVIALAQILVERKVLKGTEAEELELLQDWAKGLESDDAVDLWVEQRARAIREAWNKSPKQ